MIENLAQIVTATTILITAMSAMIVAYYRGIKDVKKEKRGLPVKIQKQSNVDVLVTEELEKLKDLTNSDVIHVFDFHNGGHYANGRSSVKLSCTYEVVRISRRPKQMELQNIPISVLSTYINMLLEKTKIDAPFLNEFKFSAPSLYELRLTYGVKSFYDIVLQNEQNEPIGVLSIIYVTSPYMMDRKECISAMYRAKYAIEDLLKTSS